ncbi:hypothetical protein JAAARDRAFT_716154 [Jaapia argillacea MUCL 33604]|uniref:F-box domain-containing protein n=1 Tax=Jaapia argillacea MUCL 33604 TaxID=933084 RepID=A0A067PDT7_9AGAM|nr:hypothetical protein JAAARDRAFT_716154 [Jaapia argillacea MUCL 33604]
MPASAASHVFCIVEICGSICEEVQAHDISSNERWQKNFLQFALCTRSICETALDILWEEVDDPEPLQKLAPPPDTEPESWSRFEMYARRVRHLRLHDGNIGTSLKLARRYSTPLFPYLQSLSFHNRRYIHLSGQLVDNEVVPFLSPTLVRLTIQCFLWRHPFRLLRDERLQAFLSTLPSKCSLLKHLVLAGSLPRFIGFDALNHIAQLRTLDVQDVTEYNIFDQPTISALSSLRSITNLFVPQVYFDPCAGVENLLNSICSPSLRSVALMSIDWTDMPHVLPCLEALSYFRSSLVTFQWEREITAPHMEKDYDWDLEKDGFGFIKPLLNLNLEHLHIYEGKSAFESDDPPEAFITPAVIERMSNRGRTSKVYQSSQTSSHYPFVPSYPSPHTFHTSITSPSR